MTVNLFVFYRIIVAAAVAMAALLAAWSVREYQLAGNLSQVIVNLLACVVILMLTAALVYANRNLTLIRHMLTGRQQKTNDSGNGSV